MTITFNWQFKQSNQFYILSFKFHPDQREHDNVWTKKDGTIVWVPTHQEQGQIGELLSLANQINGLQVRKRERLREIIDRSVKEDFEFKLTEDNVTYIIQAFKQVQGLYEEIVT